MFARLVRIGSVTAGILSAHTAVNVRLMRRPPSLPTQCGESVTVCVPARNEAENIERCLQAILSSIHVDEVNVLVLDDGSTDDTSAIVQRVFADHPSVKTHLITGGADPLPAGWLGKTWACERLRQTARGQLQVGQNELGASASAASNRAERGAQHHQQVLVFIDADVVLAPTAIAASVAMLREHQLQLVSPYPKQHAVTGGERLLQPLLQWLWLTFLPLRMAERTQPQSMAAANGQFMCIDTDALDNIDGFASVKAEVLDDVALVRAFKRAGYRGTVVDGTHLATCRMYTDWSSLKEGYSKNLWAATGSIPGAIALGTLLAVTYVVPALGITKRSTRSVGAIGYTAGVIGRLLSAHATGANKTDAVAHPVSIAVLLRLMVASWIGKRNGTLQWKGRNVS